MLKDAIQAYFFAKRVYNLADPETRLENAFLTLSILAQKNLRKSCITYSEYHHIRYHVDYLCNLKRWPIIYDNIGALHDSINRKASIPKNA